MKKDFDYLTKEHNSKQAFKSKAKGGGLTIFCILALLSLFVILLSWVVYWINGSSATGQIHPAGILELFTAPIQGFIDSASIIIFLLILSAFIKFVNDSKAIEAGIGSIFFKMKGKETGIIIILFLVFVLCGTTFNFCEAGLVFYALLIPVLLAAGFDRFTAFLVICFGAGIGCAGSTVNPILVNNAVDAANKGISNLYPNITSDQLITTSMGLIWRVVILVTLVIFVLGYTLWYAIRVKKNPTKSFIYGQKSNNNQIKFDADVIPALTPRRKVTLFLFSFTFVVLIIGALPWAKFGISGFDILGQTLAQYFPYIFGQTYNISTHTVVSNIAMIGNWSLAEMAFLFLIMSFIIAVVNWNGEKAFFNTLVAGAADFVGVCFIVALAGGFSVLLAETGIQNILINAISDAKSSMAPQLFAILIFFIFLLISIFIPSVSGFSRSVFPIMGPSLCGPVTAVNGTGVTVSGAIAEFSMASGFVNLISPTAIGFIIGLQLSEVPLSTFYKKAWPLYVGILLLSLILAIVGSSLPATGAGGLPIF